MSSETKHDALCRVNRGGQTCNCRLSFGGETKPSPAPWRWESGGTYEQDVLMGGAGNRVCDFGGGMKWEESAGTLPNPADAALIADAPAMLDLLRNYEWAGENGCPECAQSHDHPVGHWPGCKLGALLDKHGRG